MYSNSLFLFPVAKPFLKWAGGKGQLLEELVPRVPKKFNSYFEPFLGGGALFFELYNRGLLEGKKVFLSDRNRELINCYRVIQQSPLQLIKLLEKFQQRHWQEGKKFYYQVRGWDREPNFLEIDPLLRAARFIYLNKTCYNGLYRVNRKGEFNVPMGSYKKPKIVDRTNILAVAKSLEGVEILEMVFEEIEEMAKEGDFVYFDPPYDSISQNFTSYTREEFGKEEQQRLGDLFRRLSRKGVLLMESNSDTPFIRKLYQNYRIEQVWASRAINSDPTNRGKVPELIIRNY